MVCIKKDQGNHCQHYFNHSVDIAGDKEETKNLLDAAQIPVPRGTVVRNEAGLKDAIDRYGYPLVIKPIDGNHGKGNTTNITTWEQATKALEAAQQYGRSVIVENLSRVLTFRCWSSTINLSVLH
jgi:cyanophycin synthetase